MNVVIVGCGRVGSRLAVELMDDGHAVTIIDRNPVQFSHAHERGALPDDFPGNVVVGDGTDADLLRRSGIEQTDCFIAVTEGDNRNIMAAQIAKIVFKVPVVICRIYDPIREGIYRKLGLLTYCPTIDGVSRIRGLITAGGAEEG
ncbi:MAG TPA: TrkA family potassium uptake protein [Candidatus Dormibacteraeota bacterium]|nr:TrkA family potassium uptake protein [Candidatus Dormibacteraeota bacterium]